MANDPNIPRRLQPLLGLLTWEGAISRGRVLEFSEVGGVRTSEWIRELRDLHPDWMSWDPVRRRYLATDALFRAHSRPSVEVLEVDRPGFLSAADDAGLARIRIEQDAGFIPIAQHAARIDREEGRTGCPPLFPQHLLTPGLD